jgi:hypothetical protein
LFLDFERISTFGWPFGSFFDVFLFPLYPYYCSILPLLATLSVWRRILGFSGFKTVSFSNLPTEKILALRL